MKKQRKINEKKISGFTLDQTILVVAVIAILATIIISSVAWSVLSKANATKINAHLTQIGDAIGNYYQDNGHIWPTNASDLAPYLAGYTTTGNDLRTPFGTSGSPSVLSLNASGQILSGTGAAGGGACTSSDVDCYITVSMTNIQAQELEEANSSIDGAAETNPNQEGRLRWATAGGSSRTTLVYYALRKF